MLLTSKGKTNTQELITSSIQALAQALESGHSEVLSSYLKAMGRFWMLNSLVSSMMTMRCSSGM